MKKHVLATAVSLLSAAWICSGTPAEAAKQKEAVKAAVPPPVVAAASPTPYPSPPEIMASAPAGDWVAIAPSDLLVMDLAADAKGKPRRVVIQLMPAPFSQGWIGNIRKLAAAHWWDGTAIVRVQDNYVTQWGDPTEKKALPEGLAVVPESEYQTNEEAITDAQFNDGAAHTEASAIAESASRSSNIDEIGAMAMQSTVSERYPNGWHERDSYVKWTQYYEGWPLGNDQGKTSDDVEDMALNRFWPTHCYGMVGVGRNLSPDTGTGAELYTVIGHAPRHLDRNIALVGRIIEGMEHMSSLPRGTGALGFYEKPEERTKILSVRLMSEMGNDKPLPAYEYLSTESASFAKYADARANRRDPFFIQPAGGADICNIPVPVRRRK
jgi:cyclophilin family peptidyl-prolyl cis-trans isomerase